MSQKLWGGKVGIQLKMTPKSLALIIEGIATPFTAIEKTG